MAATVEFDYTPEFLKSAKILAKRYRSFPDDLKDLRDEIANISDKESDRYFPTTA